MKCFHVAHILSIFIISSRWQCSQFQIVILSEEPSQDAGASAAADALKVNLK